MSLPICTLQFQMKGTPIIHAYDRCSACPEDSLDFTEAHYIEFPLEMNRAPRVLNVNEILMSASQMITV